jgi:hypothetical protein
VLGPLAEAVAAIESAETPAGLEFINRQASVYSRIFKEAYALSCSYKYGNIIKIIDVS